MQIDQLSIVSAYFSLLFKLNDSPKWKPQVTTFLTRLFVHITDSYQTPTTAAAQKYHTFVHALSFIDSCIQGGVWLEYKNESLYDGAGILRSSLDFKQGLARIYYCDSFSQYPITYFICLVDPETRKLVNLKSQKFDVNFRRAGAKCKLKLRTSFALEVEHLSQIVVLIKKLLLRGLKAVASGSKVDEAGCEASQVDLNDNISLKQNEIVHMNRKRKFAEQFMQMRFGTNLMLNCLINMLKNSLDENCENGKILSLKKFKWSFNVFWRHFCVSFHL